MTSATVRSWRTPLLVLAAGSLLLALSLGIRHAFGLFLTPMSKANGWSRDVFSLAMAVQNLAWGAAQPFAGRFADRYGAGRVVLGGSVLYVAGLFLMAKAGTATLLVLSTGILVGLGLAGTTMSVVFGAVLRATPPEKRSLAMGVSMAVGSLGQFAMLPTAAISIGAVGWSGALLALSTLAVLMAPTAAVLAETGLGGAARPVPMRLGTVLREAFARPGFWLLGFGFFVCGFHVAFIAIHLPAFLTDRGLPPSTGATVLALVGLFNIAGSYLTGWLGGRVSKPAILVFIYGARAVVISIFLFFPLTETTAYLFGAGMGLLWLSTVPPTNGTVATVFGVENMALLGGIVFFWHQVGAFLGGWLGGKFYVMTGSYDVVWRMAVALGVVAALLNLPIREVPVARLQARSAGAA